MDRRTFNKMLAFAGGQASVTQFLSMPRWLPAAWASGASPAPQLLRFPEKTDLIVLTDRPPQLETPPKYFESNFTPNNAFFVRWHLSRIPTSIDTRTFRVTLAGNVKKPLTLSLHDLRTKFPLVTVAALCQCAGNSRSLFEPRVPGGQWGFGAMSNALWKGVRLSSLLEAAGVLPGSIQVAFRGVDEPPTPRVPRFEKSLPIDQAANGDVLLAYEMNGAPLPMLNGFPVRLVVPGWYATYWVKALSEITVLSQPLKSFWMDTAYRIPNNPGAAETPQGLSQTTVPISQMPVHSIFVRPASGERLRSGQGYTLRGVANDGGSGIKRVEVSTDGGETWVEVRLGRDLGRFSWRTWSWDWTPPMAGNYRLSVRAVSNDDQQQPASQWNRSGYQRDVIEQVEVTAV